MEQNKFNVKLIELKVPAEMCIPRFQPYVVITANGEEQQTKAANEGGIYRWDEKLSFSNSGVKTLKVEIKDDNIQGKGWVYAEGELQVSEDDLAKGKTEWIKVKGEGKEIADLQIELSKTA